MAKLNRKLAGGRNPTRRNPVKRFDRTGVVTQKVMIPDINYGAWTFIGLTPAPDFRENNLSFLD